MVRKLKSRSSSRERCQVQRSFRSNAAIFFSDFSRTTSSWLKSCKWICHQQTTSQKETILVVCVLLVLGIMACTHVFMLVLSSLLSRVVFDYDVNARKTTKKGRTESTVKTARWSWKNVPAISYYCQRIATGLSA